MPGRALRRHILIYIMDIQHRHPAHHKIEQGSAQGPRGVPGSLTVAKCIPSCTQQQCQWLHAGVNATTLKRITALISTSCRNPLACSVVARPGVSSFWSLGHTASRDPGRQPSPQRAHHMQHRQQRQGFRLEHPSLLHSSLAECLGRLRTSGGLPY
jgi:hypothetical protein